MYLAMLQNIILGFLRCWNKYQLGIAQAGFIGSWNSKSSKKPTLNTKCLLGSQRQFPSSNLQTSLTIFS